jgi:SAM-dependent methyltransferase
MELMQESSPTAQTVATNGPASRLPASRRFFRRVKSRFLQPEAVYRLYLKWKYGTGRITGSPNASLPNGVLHSGEEWREATRKATELGLPLHRAEEKNWDHLAAVQAIAARFPRSARILDAGAEFYSNVLPALFVYGFHHLYAMNLSFADPARRGPIRYVPGDITRTGFPDCFFDAITCMSVIEHGVPVAAYLREMHRLLKPGGLLITSTDYYPEPIESRDKFAHGTPIRIFSKEEMESLFAEAKACGFEATGEVELDAKERPIRWELYDLDYTFLIFTLRKP